MEGGGTAGEGISCCFRWGGGQGSYPRKRPGQEQALVCGEGKKLFRVPCLSPTWACLESHLWVSREASSWAWQLVVSPSPPPLTPDSTLLRMQG